jgi:hypothetical protein
MGATEYPAARVYRLYAVGKLLLMLIQLFAAKSLTEPGRRLDDETGHEDDRSETDRPSAFEVLTSLHLRRRS